MEQIDGAPSGFPRENVLVALGSFEWGLDGTDGSQGRLVRVGWFEDAGTGSSLAWTTTAGPRHELAPGVCEIEVPAGALLLIGAVSQGGKIVAAWEPVR